MSILYFPDRGPWGKSSWPGNSSGHIYASLFNQYKPKSFCDPMAGSFTSIDVAKEMNIEAYGLDLHQGFNALKDSIRDTIGKEVDMCHAHWPYGPMIRYSKDVWGGGKAHPDDLSECIDDNDFHEKLHLVLMNQREATKPGGYYGGLIGDLRSRGRYVSYQAEAIARMPANELASIMIKAQHNTMSGRNTYSKMKHMMITHEYLLLWQKPNSPLSLLIDLSGMAKQANNRLQSVWKVIVAQAMRSLGGEASLENLYQRIEKDAPEKLRSNENWKAKVRQTLQLNEVMFASPSRGHWALASSSVIH